MADTKLFNIKGTVKEYQSGTVTLEKELQTVIENNMNIFFGVTFLASEYRTTDGGRMDSIGIDENHCPVIFEYKRSVKENVINQGLFYLNWLLDHKDSFKVYNAYSPELIRHYEAQFIEGWQQCSDDFYKVLKESRITFFLSSFVSLVAIPFVGQLLSPHIGQELTSAIQAGAPLLNIGIGYFDYRNKISPAKADGGFSYIIKANRDGIIHI